MSKKIEFGLYAIVNVLNTQVHDLQSRLDAVEEQNEKLKKRIKKLEKKS
jgi:chaperonin cofactor prefoldin